MSTGPPDPLLLALRAAGVPRGAQARALAESGCPPLRTLDLLRTPGDGLPALAALGAQALLGWRWGRESTALMAGHLGVHPLSFPLATPPFGPPGGLLAAFGLAGAYPVALEHPPEEPGPVLRVLAQVRLKWLAIPDRCWIQADAHRPCILVEPHYAGAAKLTGCVTPGALRPAPARPRR